MVPELAVCDMPANGAVATAEACWMPGWAATPRATLTAWACEATGPCQSSGTVRVAALVIVLSESPTNRSIAASSATAAASTRVRTTVRPGERSRPAPASLR